MAFQAERRLSVIAAQVVAKQATRAEQPRSFDRWVVGSGPTRLTRVNTTSIHDAVALACRGALSNVFNCDDPHGVPFFGSTVYPVPELLFSAAHSESHIPGRHLNALLSAEAAGFSIDEAAIEKHAAAAFYSYSGAVCAPLNRSKIDGPLDLFTPHNVREGFHALAALVRYRHDTALGLQARAVAESSVEFIFSAWSPAGTTGTTGTGGGGSGSSRQTLGKAPEQVDDGWDEARLTALGVHTNHSTFIVGLARTIGSLVKLHQAIIAADDGGGACNDRETGSRALELALVLKEKCIAEFFDENGHYDRDVFGTHTHSTTCGEKKYFHLTLSHSKLDLLLVGLPSCAWHQ